MLLASCPGVAGKAGIVACGDPEEPDLALGLELLERAYAVVQRLLDVPVSVILDVVQLEESQP